MLSGGQASIKGRCQTKPANGEDMHEIGNKKAKSRTLAKRIEALEAEVAELKQQLQRLSTAPIEHPHPDAWKSTFGQFKDDPGYDSVVRLGRAYRSRQAKC